MCWLHSRLGDTLVSVARAFWHDSEPYWNIKTKQKEWPGFLQFKARPATSLQTNTVPRTCPTNILLEIFRPPHPPTAWAFYLCLLTICSTKVTELGHAKAWAEDKTALVPATLEKALNPRCFQQNRINIQGCTRPDRVPLPGSGLGCLFIALFEKSCVQFFGGIKKGVSFQLDIVFFLTSTLF